MQDDPERLAADKTPWMSRYLSELGGWFSSTVRRKAGQSLAIACESSSSLAATLLHGSSRRMSNHGVFQHWG